MADPVFIPPQSSPLTDQIMEGKPVLFNKLWWLFFNALRNLASGAAGGYNVIPLVLDAAGGYSGTPDLGLGQTQELTLALPPQNAKTITAASNASPIVITTSAAHGYASGDRVRHTGVLGNTAANGDWVVTMLSATTYSLNESAGNAAYTSGGTAVRFFVVTIAAPAAPVISTIWTLVIVQDATGGRMVTFAEGFVGKAWLAQMLSATPGTYCALTFVVRPDSRSALTHASTGMPLL